MDSRVMQASSMLLHLDWHSLLCDTRFSLVLSVWFALSMWFIFLLVQTCKSRGTTHGYAAHPSVRIDLGLLCIILSTVYPSVTASLVPMVKFTTSLSCK